MSRQPLTPAATIAASPTPAIAQAEIEAALLAAALEPDVTVFDFTDAEQAYLSLPVLHRLRRAAYAKWMTQNPPPPALAAWADQQSERFGPLVGVHTYKLPWLQALRVVRWGEEPRHWPAWSQADLDRAAQWASGDNIPFGVTYYLGPDRQTAFTPRPLRRVTVLP